MTILEAAAQLRAQQTTSRRLTEACLARIAEFDPRVNSFITVTGEQALAQADAADRELAAGQDRGPLHGIPIALKDVYNTAGIRTTAGSLLFRDYVPETDSAVTEKLAAAGAVMVGKTNLHELAYGVTSSNPHFGPVRNPWDLHCVPGGSSGGSAAAVAARMCFMATGSDTGASIRVPAAFCNAVGLKPTYGRVSRRGILPLDFSLDHMGPITLTVRDAAACLQAMAGEDPLDDTSSPEPVDDYMPPTRVSLAGVRVGVPENFYFDGIDPAAQTTTRQMVQLAAGLGAQVEVIRVPDILAMNTAARVILLSEASAVMERFRHRRAEIGDDVQAMFDQGRFLAATDYVNAQRARRVFRDEFLAIFRRVDVLFTPMSPTAAQPIGQKTVRIGDVDEDFRLATTRFARAINLLGFPALSLPCGFDARRMPLGLQMIAGPFEEKRLLAVAAALEDETEFYKQEPPL
ncbi:MAG: amidase [Acidobacteriota bacterium]|jgi:aspartyl-tRNA(Asn)/glutamyl-tRNA(Gln) amidotransferase subunit A